MAFENIRKKKEKFLKDPACLLAGDKALTELLCSDCEFYREGEDEDLACGAFNILTKLIEKKVVTVEQIVRALTE